MLHVVLLAGRLGHRLNQPEAQWDIAKRFYAGRDDLLELTHRYSMHIRAA
jgi:hypothetical protein